jgi:predicted ATP-grasp superfamily ATP-dependent carboligase
MPNAVREHQARVLIAGVSTRAMAESAARAGYAVTALDAFGDLDQHASVRALSLPRGFGVPFSAAAAATVARGLEFDAVAYLSPFENHPSAVGQLANLAPLWGNKPVVLRKARDPRSLVELLGLSAGGATRWLLKPRASGGGRNIRWWKPGESVPRGWHVQPYVEGVPGSIVFVTAAGQCAPLGLTRQLIGGAEFGATEFRYCGNILAAAGDQQFDRDASLLDSALRLAAIASKTVGLVGVNGIDFVAHDGVAHAIEINPRYSASMELVERAFGVSIFAAHADACARGVLPAFDLETARQRTRAFGKAIVFARRDVVCGDTRPWLEDPTVRDVPHPGERIAAGRPVCTVFADAPDSVLCHAGLVRRAESIYQTLDSWSRVAA